MGETKLLILGALYGTVGRFASEILQEKRMPRGSVYAELKRMKAEKLIESFSPVETPERPLYFMTRRGYEIYDRFLDTHGLQRKTP